MADDKTKVGDQDRLRINTNEDYEIRDFKSLGSLGVTEEELRAAVAAVGERADKCESTLERSEADMPAEFLYANYDRDRAKLIDTLKATLSGPKPMNRATAKRATKAAPSARKRHGAV